MRAIRQYTLFFSLVFSILILDQLTKFLVLIKIPEGTYYSPEPIPVIDNFLYLVHIYNKGAAWGILSDYSILLSGLAIVVLLLIFFFRKQLQLVEKKPQTFFGLICGGIIGNLIDRIHLGHVIDFIDVYIFTYRWPAFNIADSAITIGVTIYLYHSFTSKKTST